MKTPLPSVTPSEQVLPDGKVPPDLTVKQLKRGAAALRAFGIYVHVDYAAWQTAIDSSKTQTDTGCSAKKVARSCSKQAESAGPSSSTQDGSCPQCGRHDDEAEAVRTKSMDDLRILRHRAKPCIDGSTPQQPSRHSLEMVSSSPHSEGGREEVLSLGSTMACETVSHQSHGLDSPQRNTLLPELPARLRLLRSHHHYHHMNQAAVASPRSPRNGYAIPSPESRREGSSPPSTASSNSILKKTCSSHGSQEGREDSSCGKKMGKMVRITTSTPNMSTSRPRRSSSPKSPSGHTGAKSMQRSARHAQDYRTSNAFDPRRQQEEMCRRRRIAEDLVRKEIKAQREAERVLQRELETRHDQVLEECRRAQETHLRRIEEQDKLLKEYEALRLAPTGHVEPSRGKSKERRLERHLVAQGDERSASDSLREPHGFPTNIQQEAPSDTSAEPSLPHDSVGGDIVSSPASFHSRGSYRQASLDSRSPFSISRGTSVTRQDNSHEGSQGRVAPSRSRSPPSTTPSLSRSARLHRSSSRLLRAIFRQQEQQQQQQAEVEGEQRERLDVKPRDSSTGSQRTDRGRRPSLRVTTNLTTLGKCEVKAQSAEDRKDQSFRSKGSKIDHEHNNAGELAASSAPSLPRTHTRARSTGRGGAGQGQAGGGGLLGNSACPCEDGFKCTNRAICWATRKLRGRGPPG